jgi:glycosyltransferase involved in cell wall biosynthesis
MSSPQVSVLLPTYNRAHYVAEAIQSALDQTFADLEVVVVDDGSTDTTSEVLGRIADPRVRCFRQENRGISGALNTAFRSARGRYVAILNSDDRWLPDLLAEEVAILQASSNVGLVYARCQAMDSAGRPLARLTGVPARYPGQMFKSLLHGDHICTIAVLIRRELVEQVGLWDERLIANEDWDLWLRLALVCQFHFVDKILARFRVHPGRITNTSSERFARLAADRIRVVDKVYALPDLPPEAAQMRSLAYHNVYIDVGLRWLKARDWRESLRYFSRAIQLSPRPASTLIRIASLAAFQAFLSDRAGGVRLLHALGRWRRGRRA